MVNNTSFTFTGEIIVGSNQEFVQDYIQFPFSVPNGIESLKVELTYEPQFVNGITNLITLGLFDPLGFRGNAHREPSELGVILTPSEATVGFIPGPIRPGDWLAQLSVHAVVADTKPCKYKLQIQLVEGMSKNPGEKKPWNGNQQLVHSSPGWYRGELHSHTIHSDGTNIVQELINNAAKKNLDFLAITDHNTTSTLFDLNQANFQNILIIPGFELTTFHGHALALGIDKWVDWRTGYNGWTINDAAREVKKLGGTFILAHPNDIGSPRCTGCKWEYPDINLDFVDAVEIWNSGWWEGEGANNKNLLEWQNLYKDHRHIPFTAGTDFHQVGDWDKKVAFTYVFAKELSVNAILEGIRKGRVIISSGPKLSFHGVPGEGHELVGVGDTLITSKHENKFNVTWEDVPDKSELIVHSNSGINLRVPISGSGSKAVEINVYENNSAWIELFAQDGSLLAITNPIYIMLK